MTKFYVTNGQFRILCYNSSSDPIIACVNAIKTRGFKESTEIPSDFLSLPFLSSMNTVFQTAILLAI